ncbi:MAG: hypothetical protein B7Y39_04605 [Bdellovibrio sp. 28-41-41]|nr:MAG: hypothetical protein B7Y39_04605 [Bdellovibrio sp. 28-41-41]
MSSLATTAGGIVAGATMSSPFAFAKNLTQKTAGTYRGVSSVGGGVISRAQKAHEWINKNNPSSARKKMSYKKPKKH